MVGVVQRQGSYHDINEEVSCKMFTDHVSHEGKAIGGIHLSVHLFPLSFKLTDLELEFFYVYWS